MRPTTDSRTTPAPRYAFLICYEAILPEFMRGQYNAARLLMNLTTTVGSAAMPNPPRTRCCAVRAAQLSVGDPLGGDQHPA
jgi:hypothetical protein